MLKRFSILTLLVFSALALAALTPMNRSSSATAQDTVAPTISIPTSGPTVVVPTVVSTVIVPVTGPNTVGLPLSTLIIIGLLVLLGLAIIIGGLAMNRREPPPPPPP